MKYYAVVDKNNKIIHDGFGMKIFTNRGDAQLGHIPDDNLHVIPVEVKTETTYENYINNMDQFVLKFTKKDDGQWFCSARILVDDEWHEDYREYVVKPITDESGNDIECQRHNPSECASYLLKQLKELYEV